MRASLVPLDGGPAVDLTKDLTLVGRGEDCDLCIDHKSVSKLHCILVVTDGLVLVRDLGSTNGTRVNGQRVRRAALLPNDNLAIANFKYQLRVVVPAVDVTDPTVNGRSPPDPGGVKRNALPDAYTPDEKKP